MKIRKATKGDLKEIVNLWLEFIKEHDAPILRNKKLAAFEKKRKNIRELEMKNYGDIIRSKKGDIFVVEHDGKLVGFEVIAIKPDTPIMQNKELGFISEIYVQSKFRGQGLASKLNKKAIKWFKSKEIRFLTLNVYKHNKKAQKLYKKWGFEDYATEMRKKLK